MSSNPFRRFLDEQGFVVLDGGLATALEAGGHVLDGELWSARLLLDDPGAIRAVHADFLRAGADCIASASYQASFAGFERLGLSRAEAETVLRTSVRLAVEARDAFWSDRGNRPGRIAPIVAASAGPYGAFLADGSEYDGRYGVGPSVLRAFHGPRAEVLADTDADLVAFETIPSLPETEVIAGLLAEITDGWAWLSFSCRDGARLWDGSPVGSAVEAAGSSPRLAGVGVNCTAPRFVTELVERIGSVTDVPVIAYPNSGETYDPVTRAWAGPAARGEWLSGVSDWVEAGARVIGGCCRVAPDVIGALRAGLSANEPSPTLSSPPRRPED